MSSPIIKSGTEPLRRSSFKTSRIRYDLLLHLYKGDEPYIDPEQISKLISCFNDSGTQIATLIKKVLTNEELHNTNSPKVIINKHSEAIYFSRSPLPHIRGQEASKLNGCSTFTYFKHIGIYGYHRALISYSK